MSPGPRVSIPGCGNVQRATQPASRPLPDFSTSLLPQSLSAGVQPAKLLLGKMFVTEPSKVLFVLGPRATILRTTSTRKGLMRDNDEEGYNCLYSEEHYLNLNVFVPKDHLVNALHLIPVMVFIYGDEFRDGSNAMALYDATNICAQSVRLGQPVVVMTINYRLNYLGLMSSAELVEDINSDPRLSSLTSGSNNPHSKSIGNWGLLDQKLALEWVRDHIHVFGGNSQDITAFSESAGAASIGYHMTIPEHHGLFQRAILQSGAVNTMPVGRAQIEGQRYFNHICKHFRLLDALRMIPVKELVKAGGRGRVVMFMPTIDDILIHGDSRTDGEASKISSEVVRDSVFLYPIHATSRTWAVPVEMSRFHFDRPLKTLKKMGLQFLEAHHAAELLFVFGSDSALKMMTDEEQRLSRQMMEH
ncbi:hypothetical protein BG006_010675 [Podila minutissima]|uniref:Carboxylesterase type B domain-containing protein n=1 Tax=Podila minutissima TaxID=64525 RepID=A0A9P5SR70_9FUNG|nr:hypothetical protein BG006_010675 [Podila minutissima]